MKNITPLAWLFAEIERRYGEDTARELHTLYLEQNRAYQLRMKQEEKERHKRFAAESERRYLASQERP